MLMEQIGSYYMKTEKTIFTLKEDVETWKEQLHADMELWKEELKLYFDVAVENNRHDLLAAKHDDIENLKIRVGRLERHARFKAA